MTGRVPSHSGPAEGAGRDFLADLPATAPSVPVSGRGPSDPQDFLAELDEPQYDLVERPGEALTNRLTCIRCRGSRRDGGALCRRCRWSPRRVVQVWWHAR